MPLSTATQSYEVPSPRRRIRTGRRARILASVRRIQRKEFVQGIYDYQPCGISRSTNFPSIPCGCLPWTTVEKAKSGHPGAPLGCAPIAYLLFHKLMKHNPAHSKWADRDRFVLSNGHASALLYGTLFLAGYKRDAGRSEELPAVGIADAGASGVRATRTAWK